MSGTPTERTTLRHLPRSVSGLMTAPFASVTTHGASTLRPPSERHADPNARRSAACSSLMTHSASRPAFRRGTGCTDGRGSVGWTGPTSRRLGSKGRCGLHGWPVPGKGRTCNGPWRMRRRRFRHRRVVRGSPMPGTMSLPPCRGIAPPRMMDLLTGRRPGRMVPRALCLLEGQLVRTRQTDSGQPSDVCGPAPTSQVRFTASLPCPLKTSL
jgi:hypothetical protein